MIVQGNQVLFECPGGQLVFHRDLRTYSKVHFLFKAKESVLLEWLSQKTISSAKEILDELTKNLIDIIETDIIIPLSNLGVYDLISNDFLSNNPGYLEIFSATEAYSGHTATLTDMHRNIADIKKQQAADRANQEITGMGFGVISSDPLAHALYAAKQSSVLNKQANKAQWKYNRESIRIDAEVGSAIHRDTKEYIDKVYRPQIMNGVIKTIDYFIAEYCRKLASVGKIDLACLNGIDEERANAIMDNLGLVSDKEALIRQAIQLCPYNLSIYIAVFNNNLRFLELYKDVLCYFDLVQVYFEFLKDSVHGVPISNMSSAYSAKKAQIDLYAFLKGQSLIEAARELLIEDFQQLLKIYADTAYCINNNASIVELMKKRYPNIQVRYGGLKNVLLSELGRAHFTEQEISFCDSNCGIGVFQSLSAWFGSNITSFEQADSIIISRWDSDSQSAEQDEIIASLEQKLFSAKWDYQHYRDTYASAQNNNIICLILTIIVGVFLLCGAVTQNEPGILLSGLFILLLAGLAWVFIKYSDNKVTEDFQEKISQLESDLQKARAQSENKREEFIQSQAVCPRCGANLNSGETFCSQCGCYFDLIRFMSKP